MLAVLSTATYAWYSVVNRAGANSITFTASSQEGGGDLAIGWKTEDTTSFVLNFDDPTNDLYPMIPRNMASIDVTKFSDFISGNFNSSNQTLNTLNELICTVPGQDANPYVCMGTTNTATQNHFFLMNRSDTFDMEVSVVYDITGTLISEKLRVAIFVGTTTQNQMLKGIMSNSNNIHYGDIFTGQKVSEIPIMTNVYRDTLEIKFNVNKEEYVVISLVAWLDGAVMTDDDAEKNVVFGVRFDGIAV